MAEALSREYVRQVNARASFGAFWEGSDAVIPGSGFNEKIPWIDLNPVVMQESDLGESVRRVGKNILHFGKVVGFVELPTDFKRAFRDGLAKTAPEVKEILRQQYSRADYILISDKRSCYNRLTKVVELGPGYTPSTLAHELFHKIDAWRRFSRGLSEALKKDYAKLKVASNRDVKGYLLQQYPKAFSEFRKTGEPIMGEPYRGIADILNGLSEGRIDYGYSHPREYWLGKGNLEREAWAQFGRIQFDNNKDVLEMFQDIFPNLLGCAKMILQQFLLRQRFR